MYLWLKSDAMSNFFLSQNAFREIGTNVEGKYWFKVLRQTFILKKKRFICLQRISQARTEKCFREQTDGFLIYPNNLCSDKNKILWIGSNILTSRAHFHLNTRFPILSAANMLLVHLTRSPLTAVHAHVCWNDDHGCSPYLHTELIASIYKRSYLMISFTCLHSGDWK